MELTFDKLMARERAKLRTKINQSSKKRKVFQLDPHGPGLVPQAIYDAVFRDPSDKDYKPLPKGNPEVKNFKKAVDLKRGISAEWIPAHANNFMVGRNGRPVEYVVIHSIVGTLETCIRTFQSPTRIASSTFITGWSGRQVQMVRVDDTPFTNGNWEINLRSETIENDDQGQPYIVRPDALYEATAQRLAEICIRRGIPCNRTRIKKHSEVSLAGTACPAGLDTDRIVARAAQIINDIQNPTPPPAPTPPPNPIKYFRFPTIEMVTNKQPTNLWNFGDVALWPNLPIVKVFNRGEPFAAVGYAKHPKGSEYYMTAFSFGDADISGKPKATNGVNKVDLDLGPPPTPIPVPPPVPDPVPIPLPPPEPDPTPVPLPTPEPTPVPAPTFLPKFIQDLIAWITNWFKTNG